MPFEFKLPDLGEGITEAEIRRWLVAEGDLVAEHQPVLEVETDKALVEVPAPRSGRVLHIAQTEGQMARVGDLLMTIGESGHQDAGGSHSVSVVGELPEADDSVLATPAVRKLARELGVNLETVTGHGPRGSITREDLLTVVTPELEQLDQFGQVERKPLRGVRRSVARNVSAAQRLTAPVTAMDEADITELSLLREREQPAMAARGVHLTLLPFIVKAVQHALQDHPVFNASVDDDRDEIVLKKYIHIGMAVDTSDGLMVPVLTHVDRKSIVDLSREIRDLAERAKSRKLRVEELRGSSFTVSNFGQFGGTFATPIINHPNVAILGTGRAAQRPWVKDGQLTVRTTLPLSLTFDHRVTDGGEAARFLAQILRYLEDPALLFIESR